MNEDDLVDVLLVLKENNDLREIFLKVLEQASFSQQQRIAVLRNSLEKKKAPQEVIGFLKSLSDVHTANFIYNELKKAA
ncbi:MAG: hypothetical protein VX642_16130 [Bdellovibrionota bacterium]|nr:hypothetical protein [Bdellovibrionota bacterium]